jgi:molybdenum cofactor biosynthesis enzyme MoaA
VVDEASGRLGAERPVLAFRGLETLWLQVTGTLCNLGCRHCLVSAGPKVLLHRPLSVKACRSAIEEAAGHGLREVWMTGGEPFLHPQILEIVDLALEKAAVGILTNGTLIDDAMAEALGRRFREAPHNLEIRVSLDGATAEENDAIRGKGEFLAATAGIERLVRHGLEPIVAVTLLDDRPGDRDAFVALLSGLGVRRPRVKWIPAFVIGREAGRKAGHGEPVRLVPADLTDEAAWRLACGTSRTVTSQGVFPCPILINEPGRRIAGTLGDALVDHPVDHPACATCYAEGFSCST